MKQALETFEQALKAHGIFRRDFSQQHMRMPGGTAPVDGTGTEKTPAGLMTGTVVKL